MYEWRNLIILKNVDFLLPLFYILVTFGDMINAYAKEIKTVNWTHKLEMTYILALFKIVPGINGYCS